MGPPLYRVLYPDWLEWAGIPGNVFSLLLTNAHNVTVIPVGIQSNLTLKFYKKITLTAILNMVFCLRSKCIISPFDK